MDARSEEQWIRYRYRRMILDGKARISLDAARSLVGPDCAYHLYGVLDRLGMPQRGRAAKGPAHGRIT